MNSRRPDARGTSSLLAIVALLSACRTRPEVPPPALSTTPVYTLDVRLRPEAHELELSGTLTLPRDSVARDSLVVQLGERFATLDIEILRPAEAGPVTVQRGDLPSGDRVPGERRSVRWIVRPVRPIAAGEQVTLRFATTGSGSTGMLYYMGPEVSFASGWGDRWYPVVDGVWGLGTGAITVRAPQGWKVITGADADGTPEEEGAGTFRFSQRLATYFTFVAGPYSLAEVDRGSPRRVTAWQLTPRAHLPHLLAGITDMMRVLESEFGPFPFGNMALVEVPRPLAQAAGFNAFSPTGFIVVNSRSFDAKDAKYQYEWLGHEMGHQWFPHAVTFDEPGFPYLEEALAEYGGIQVVRHLGGEDAVRQLRTIGYEFDPIYSAAAYFHLVGAGADEPLATMGNGINERNLAYNKGALVFDMLSREVGSGRFREVMRGLTAGRQLSSITWPQFLAAVDAGAGRRMDWFFDQWLTRSGAPDFQLSWRQDGSVVRGTITQTAPYYRAQLRIDLHGKDGARASQVVTVTGASRDFSLTPSFRVSRMVLDPNYEVLRWTPEYRALADSIRRASR